MESIQELRCWGMSGGRRSKSASPGNDAINEVPDQSSDAAINSNTWAAWSLAKQESIVPTSAAIRQSTGAMADRYSIGMMAVGRGTFGVVKCGVDKRSGRPIAVKFVKGRFVDVVREAIVLGALQHGNIVCILDAFKTADGAAYVLEHGGRNLQQRHESAP